MTAAPKLLHHTGEQRFPPSLAHDLQMDKIFSANTIAVLNHTCSTTEIRRRQQLFSSPRRWEIMQTIGICMSALNTQARALSCWRRAKLPLERSYLLPHVFSAYINACQSLAALGNCHPFFADLTAFFANTSMQTTLSDMQHNCTKASAALQTIGCGMLSFSDKHWLTPNRAAVDEYTQIAHTARELGFSVIDRRKLSVTVDTSFSDAFCRLHQAELDEIDAIFAPYAEIDTDAPTKYLPELEFLSEIFTLLERTAQLGIPHCIPAIADKPQYIARDVYDISLIAKGDVTIVPNHADFSAGESVVFLTGANGGGKTTYLRAIGINLVLFLAGCPIFATEADIYPFTHMASHFPRDERFDHIGRLDEEIQRAQAMLESAEQKMAFFLLNETFSGTDDKRGFAYLQALAKQIRSSNHFCLCVTHFHGITETDFPILSAEIDPTDANKRTYRIFKAKGRISAYAADILKKYRLDRSSLAERRCSNGN